MKFDANALVQKLLDGTLTGVGVIIAVIVARKLFPGVI